MAVVSITSLLHNRERPEHARDVTGRLPVLGPAGADGAVGVGYVATGGLHLGAVRVGLLIEHLEVTS